MNSGKSQFLAGTLVAFLITTMALDGDALLAAVGRSLALHQLPPEIRQAYDLEILPPSAFTVDNWKEEITSREFRLAVQKTLQLLGDPAAERLSLMVTAGILPRKGNKAIILRREAFETVFRALVHLWNEGLLAPPVTTSSRKRFSDYAPPKQFRQAMAYLFENRILQGYLDGRLKAGRPLTNRDCLFLLSRFYAHVAAERPGTGGDGKATFVGITTKDWLNQPLARLEKAGAFSFTRLGPNLEGNRTMSLADTAGMVSGILSHHSRNEQLTRIQEIVSETTPVRQTARCQLARLSAVLVGAFVTDGTTGEFPYVDVLPDSSEGMALRRLAGIGVKMGYPTGRFSGDEPVSRFEVIGTLNAILDQILPGEVTVPATAADAWSTPPADGQSATPADHFDRFVEQMEAKQARIREILHRRPAHSQSGPGN